MSFFARLAPPRLLEQLRHPLWLSRAQHHLHAAQLLPPPQLLEYVRCLGDTCPDLALVDEIRTWSLSTGAAAKIFLPMERRAVEVRAPRGAPADST